MNIRRRFPEAGALARARALLLEAGLAVPMNDWASLATICDTPWLPATRRTTPSAMRIARRRLQPLLAPPVALDAIASMPRGEVVHVQGAVQPLPAQPAGAVLWRTRTVRGSDGVWLVEEGEDLELCDPTGGRVVVLAEGGHLINGDLVCAGDPVSVFGVLDDIPDRRRLGAAPGRTGVMPALRSSPRHPLLLSLLRRYDQGDGPRK
jgi:hypothetical protein